MKASKVTAKNGRTQAKGRKTKKENSPGIGHLRSLSSIEGTVSGIAELQQLAGTASVIAAERAMIIGLPRVYATDKEVIKEAAGGRTVLALSTDKATHNGFYVKYKKGTILHAAKK